ncbi:MAG TPA: nucleotidyltransferase family protein [Candidatus Acetatifactor stercoripullorum]|uniref:Nucleotidyltransferase family protein n=1 Tax=Candidatus Acetatifactor stercoripullorum TaxID=2838414 RepID=A0A9D1UC76_9FIRM|nr:nucleotidyltransferase family protein [uncultured Acetatifactor sp.]HIW82514.1 nucleotidyltransferase family protein [Candidatus Acetatifactor stercoripullorum]
MTKKSRTEYSARNTTVAIVARIIAILAGFLTRVVFTHTLSESYVGINGLFTDILNILSLSELGVGTAITCALYRPIAEEDLERQKSLMRMYRTFYRVVAAIVLVCGLMVLPFLDVLIKDGAGIEHITFIYLMYLLNSVLSYLLVYKKTLIDAHQQSYIGVLYQTGFLLLQNALQIAALLLTGNFILFVSILILCTLGNNFCISRKADKMYPYLRQKSVQRLPRQERKGIYRDVRAMLMHKVGNVIVNNTDNLLLSSMVGIASVSCYSNYYLIIGSVRQVLNQMFQGITASVGNLGVEESTDRVRRIFEAAFFAGQWVFGLAAVCLYELIDPFVALSFGEQYVFPREVTLILCLNFYLTGMRQACLVFRDSIGLFRYDRYKSLAEAAINLAASVILGRSMGTAGIFIGTMISTVTTSLWVEPYMLYKHHLKTSAKPYFLRYGLYSAVTLVLGAAADSLCGQITGPLSMVLVCRLLICVFLVNSGYLILYCRRPEFKLLVRKGRMLAGRWRQKRRASQEDALAQKKDFGPQEAGLLNLLKEALGEEESADERPEYQWSSLLQTARLHGVLPLLFLAKGQTGQAPEAVREEILEAARKTVMQSYRLLFLSKYLIGTLEKEGIRTVLLKGAATASFYPEPELRKSGDVDLLLLCPNELARACAVLKKKGFWVKEKQTALHHVVFSSKEGIEIELHTMLAEPFDHERINRYLEEKLRECGEHVYRKELMGVELPVLEDAFHAYELLLHMLQHFLRAGFGLKLLCDWTVFWGRCVSQTQKEQYLCLVKESGLKGFSDTVTLACCAYLGLARERVEWMGLPKESCEREFMEEILEAEEFGKSAADRMVALREAGLRGFAREFHHQMRLNFPRAGSVFFIWPALWTVTLARFLLNNRRIRRVSGWSILKKARQRSRLMAGLKLWKKEK